MLEKVADSARKAVKLAEPYKPYRAIPRILLHFFIHIPNTHETHQKSTEFCQFFCRHCPSRPNSHTRVRPRFWESCYENHGTRGKEEPLGEKLAKPLPWASGGKSHGYTAHLNLVFGKNSEPYYKCITACIFRQYEVIWLF